MTSYDTRELPEKLPDPFYNLLQLQRAKLATFALIFSFEAVISVLNDELHHIHFFYEVSEVENGDGGSLLLRLAGVAARHALPRFGGKRSLT